MSKISVIFTVTFVVFISFLKIYQCLECYVCDKQDDNKEKCVKTIKTCNYDEDVCTTQIKYGSTPYWEEGAPKQYYITKNCSTLENALKSKKDFMRTCTYVWYEDWKCFDYCRGDRCNYFIVSSAQTKSTITISIVSVMVTLILSRIL